MIFLSFLYFLFIENMFAIDVTNKVGQNFHLSFCDMKPNCDGDSELFDRIVQAESRKQDNDNHLYDYPVIRTKRAFAPYRTGKTVASKVSEILDNLLLHSDYDKRIRPQFGGPPITVVINLSIRSMGPVDENKRTFYLDCYFRQKWKDERLTFNATDGVQDLALNWAFLAKIWVPDTFFVNGKQSYRHKITVPNMFVRISPDGTVSYSQRLTVSAYCPMDLSKFPLDSQICKLEIGSFGYSAEDMIYRWSQPKAVSLDDIDMAQMKIVKQELFEEEAVGLRRTRNAFRNDSTLTLEFYFDRQTGFFLLQIYTPLTLIVFCSWVAFWLIKTEKGGEVPARTALGATSVLSIVNIGFGGKGRPHVPYATAMDNFIILCFVAVFAALVEFACINFIDTFVKNTKQRIEAEKAKAEEEKQKAKEKVEEAVVGLTEFSAPATLLEYDKDTLLLPLVEITEERKAPQEFLIGSHSVHLPEKQFPTLATSDDDEFDDIDEFEETNGPLNYEDFTLRTETNKSNICCWLSSCLQFVKNIPQMCTNAVFKRLEMAIEAHWGPLTERNFYNNTTEVIWSIDSYARRMFPLCFMILQLIYWSSYLYIM